MTFSGIFQSMFLYDSMVSSNDVVASVLQFHILKQLTVCFIEKLSF